MQKDNCPWYTDWQFASAVCISHVLLIFLAKDVNGTGLLIIVSDIWW